MPVMNALKISSIAALVLFSCLVHAEEIQVYKHLPSIQVYKDCAKKGDACAIMDEALAKQLKDENEEWQRQMKKMSLDAEDFYFNGNPAAGAYARDWFVAYQKNDGLLKYVEWLDRTSQANENEYAQICWGLNNIAMSYLKIKAKLSADERKKIEAWLKDVASKAAYGKYRYNESDYYKSLNNHYYSRAMALMAVGVATSDQQMIKDAKFVINKAMSDLDVNTGTWPLEMARKTKALHYQTFALSIVKIAVYDASLVDPDWANSIIHDQRMALADKAAVRLFADTEFHKQLSGGFEPDRRHAGRCGSWAYPYIQLSTDAAFRNSAPKDMRYFYEGCAWSYMIGGNPELMRERFYKIQ